MKIKDVINLRNAIVEIKDAKMPCKTAYKLAKIMMETDDDIELVKEKQRNIFAAYANKNGDINIPNELQDKINEEFNDLLNVDISVPVVKFDVSEFQNIEASVAVMNALLPFIEE